MQVTIKGQEKQIPVQTITLQPETGENLYAFHCLHCGNFHQKIGGKVSKIYPIYEPSDQVPVISRCRNCGAEYVFQTHDGYSTEQIKVILQPTNITSYFYCYRGKDRILEYSALTIYSLTRGMSEAAPFHAGCSNADCGVTYAFTTFC